MVHGIACIPRSPRHRERSEAIHAATHTLTFSRQDLPEVCMSLAPRKRGSRECRVHAHYPRLHPARELFWQLPIEGGSPNAYEEGCCHAPSHIPGRKPLLASRPDRWTRASLVNRSGRTNSFGHLVDRPRLRLRGIADPLADGTAAPPGMVPRAAAGRGKSMAAAYGAGRLRSRKQKDADQQTCCECPQA